MRGQSTHAQWKSEVGGGARETTLQAAGGAPTHFLLSLITSPVQYALLHACHHCTMADALSTSAAAGRDGAAAAIRLSWQQLGTLSAPAQLCCKPLCCPTFCL